MTRRTVVVLGKGDLAVRIAEWFRSSEVWDLVAVVPVIPEPAWTSSLVTWAESEGVPCVESGAYEDVDNVLGGGSTFDLAFSVFYDRIIREDFIRRCRRILNLHNSPLPKYRGVSPINWALRNGEAEHGVTIHEIVPAVDAGPVVAQLRYSIYPTFDEVRDVYVRALAYGYTLFEQTMPIVDRIPPRPQDEAEVSHYTRADDARLGDRRGFSRA